MFLRANIPYNNINDHIKKTSNFAHGRCFMPSFNAIRKYHQQIVAEDLQNKALRPRYYYTDPNIKPQNSRAKSGDVLLQRLRTCLGKMPVERHSDQIRFHDEFLRAVAPGLYGPQFETDYKRILRQNNWKSIRKQAMVITPRRWGKTFCVAMFIAAYLICVPNATQCVFSTSARVSQLMLELIYRFVCAILGDTKKIKKYTTETLWLEGEHSGDIRKIFSYPSNEKI